MDAITPLAFDLTAMASRAPGAGITASSPVATAFDIARFDAAYAVARPAPAGVSDVPRVSSGENAGLRSVLVTLQEPAPARQR
jgi:hypothetical protein